MPRLFQHVQLRLMRNQVHVRAFWCASEHTPQARITLNLQAVHQRSQDCHPNTMNAWELAQSQEFRNASVGMPASQQGSGWR